MKLVQLIPKTLPPFPFAEYTMKGDDDVLKCNAQNSGHHGALLGSSGMEENAEGDEFCIECEDQLPEIVCIGCSNEVGGEPMCERAFPSPF